MNDEIKIEPEEAEIVQEQRTDEQMTHPAVEEIVEAEEVGADSEVAA